MKFSLTHPLPQIYRRKQNKCLLSRPNIRKGRKSRSYGWTNLTLPGKRGAEGPVGPKGDKGDQGARGDAAPTILEWVLDYDNYRAIPLMSDGSPAPVLELRPLFERFFEETAHGR
jgi:hypothetical protein